MKNPGGIYFLKRNKSILKLVTILKKYVKNQKPLILTAITEIHYFCINFQMLIIEYKNGKKSIQKKFIVWYL